MAAASQPTGPGLARDGCLGLLHGMQEPEDLQAWRSSVRNWASWTSKASPPHCLETLGFVLRPAPEGSAFASRGTLLASLQATTATACQSGPNREGASESKSNSWTWEPAAQGHQLAVQPEYSESRPLPLSEMQRLLP